MPLLPDAVRPPSAATPEFAVPEVNALDPAEHANLQTDAQDGIDSPADALASVRNTVTEPTQERPGLARDLLRCYRTYVSAQVIFARHGQVCVQEPFKGESCSVYARRQFDEHSVLAAIGKSAWRIMSCNRINPIPYLRSETP